MEDIIDVHKVTNIEYIPFNKFLCKPVIIGYATSIEDRPYPGRYKNYIGAFLDHNEKYIYMGNGEHHFTGCKMEELHWLGRKINRVKRFKKSNIMCISTLEEKLRFEVQ